MDDVWRDLSEHEKMQVRKKSPRVREWNWRGGKRCT
jgi:hypothetical protein